MKRATIEHNPPKVIKTTIHPTQSKNQYRISLWIIQKQPV